MSDTSNLTDVDTDFEGSENVVKISSKASTASVDIMLDDYDNLPNDPLKASLLTGALIVTHIGRNGDKGAFFLNNPKFHEPKVCALVCKSLRTLIAQTQAQITEQPDPATASVREIDAWCSQSKKVSILAHVLEMVERVTTPAIATKVAVVIGHTPRNTPEPT